MDAETPLDHAMFQLSPRRTRCELFVSGEGRTEKLASGFLKPFVAHLRVAEEQAVRGGQTIRLELERRDNGSSWFNKGTLERFVRFVSTPEVLELVSTFDAEMSQLEGARRIYSQGTGDQHSAASSGENERATAAAADITKKELLRAIDDRLVAVNQDLTLACARASAAGFTIDNVSELLLFAERFGAQRLNEACGKFIYLCRRRPELLPHQHPEIISQHHIPSPTLPIHLKGFNDGNIRSSSDSDMSIAEPEVEPSSTSRSQPIQMTTQHAAAEPAATCQQPKTIARSLLEKDVDKETKEPTPSAASAEPTQQSGGGSRRLSVQDRINLFESKKKEQSTGTNVITSSVGGGTNRVAGKPEHRRLPSDVSEKSVLRRWSGASDMSIDLNNSSSSCTDRKDIGSPVTISASANSQTQAASKTEEEANRLKDTTTSQSQLSFKDIAAGTPSSSSLSLFEAQVGVFPIDRDHAEDVFLREGTTASKMQSVSALEEGDQSSGVQFGATVAKVRQGGLSAQDASITRSEAIPDPGELAGSKDQEASVTRFKDILEKNVEVKDNTVLQSPQRVVSAGVKLVEGKDRVNLRSRTRDITGLDVQLKNHPDLVTKFKILATDSEDARANTKGLLDSQLQFKTSTGKTEDTAPKSDPPLPSQPMRRTLPGKKEEIERKEVSAYQAWQETSMFEGEQDSRPQGMKLPKEASAPGQTMKLQGRTDQRLLNLENAATLSLVNKAKEDMEMFDSPMYSMEPVQAARPSKGNQELNDALQMKANELEKLFAAHKHRVRNDQMSSSRRSKPIDVEEEDVPLAVERRPTEANSGQLLEKTSLEGISNYGVEFDAPLLLNMLDNRDYNNNLKQGLGDFSRSEEFRGKFYEKYMQKRNAKLREEWGSKRVHKEAKMKAMHDSLELSQTEMKAKFAVSATRQDLSSAHHRAEKMKSFKARLDLKNKGQTVEYLQGEEGKDLQELSERFLYSQDKSYNDTLFGSENSVNIQSKKLSSSKLVSSSTSRIPVVPVPRPSAKGVNSGSMKRRVQIENTLVQSVPNFSDFRKENTKPSAGLNKVTPRVQSKNFVRSKSSNEETNLVKDENPQRSHSMRKSSANPVELKDLSPLSSDGTSVSLSRISKEQTEQTVPNKIQRSGELRQFLRKGNGIGPGAGAGISKLKASTTSQILKNGEEYGVVGQHDDLPDMLKYEEDEFERPSAEGNLRTMDFSVDSDSEKPRLSQDSDNSGNPGSENADALRSLSQADDDLVAVTSKYDISAGNMLESPGESPGSWNSHIHHPFTYPQEASDIDASVDSPTSSPAFWNSNPLNQMMEADAARMRKKWGSAQIPVLVADASNQSHKDVRKGFKRLLKFGRKSKGTDFLVNDWVSASTASEGDDDAEDGRDLTNRSSDDLRKSRMGYPVVAYDDLNEGEVYPEQVQSLRSSIPNPPANFRLREERLSGSSLKAPRSFFSLSSFRSKGGESKLR